jgi:hypothetical protein
MMKWRKTAFSETSGKKTDAQYKFEKDIIMLTKCNSIPNFCS